ncbi:L-ascorbate metabolism protein UlaG, beta-lactamase superfamily [Natronincola peptidivorans]|uniref:L-ascorbate metabolism protein UlaG, beta-lactamase superfamily n=1 Tax=Natronincola peptidivorans TaxID=426128 RepID=A0A1I0H783_9FIRM|nr:MBL fold metallo-hydrolase [Natronincola peptidivorans]SET79564.1 L-ascorbate metabolism protein UlaG, beta-lactamase superfamily [Natronincola peptidivorans]
MSSTKINIHHLGHSSFAVETLNYYLIFDYYHDSFITKKHSFQQDVFTEKYLKTPKKVIIFVTHSHGDHYNRFIFQWENINPKINYVLSHDIKDDIHKKSYLYMHPYEELVLEDIIIQSYGTTDKGVSFLVKVDGITLFHAGDLNWWHWKDFTDEQQKAEEEDFKKEVSYLPTSGIDVAFLPVDPRLEEYYHLAGVYFAKMLKPKLLVPMHFRDNYYICHEFTNKLQDPSIEVAQLKRLGDIVTYSPL